MNYMTMTIPLIEVITQKSEQTTGLIQTSRYSLLGHMMIIWTHTVCTLCLQKDAYI